MPFIPQTQFRPRRTPQQPTQTAAKPMCFFCLNNDHVIDEKDTLTLQRFLSSHGKIAPRRRSGVCAFHQRKLARAIKRARILSLLPFSV